jgi:adenylate cyclase
VTHAQPRILVVDDNDDNLYTLKQRLARQGYGDVMSAVNGREALDLLAAGPFDLVLLDLMMPEIDGFGVLERMRADTALRHVPVIMISAISELDGVVRCIELGAQDYLTKPFNGVLLQARVGACLERKRLHDREVTHRLEVERERRRADQLLHAILPASAVAELKATDRVQPRRFEDVVVLIADVAGFTSYCDARPPEEVVSNLQLLVEAFEASAVRFGMEKIKTIGDAVMATAGLLEPNEDPVMAALRCAFATAAAARGNPARWEVRIGIHRGPVVAGVVGRSKFSFDLWGDTVNVAARLAGLGQESGIYLTAAAWRHVVGRAQATALGCVPLKGKSAIEVYRCDGLEDWLPAG